MRATPQRRRHARPDSGARSVASFVAALAVASCGDATIAGPRDGAPSPGSPSAAIAPRSLRPKVTDTPPAEPVEAIVPEATAEPTPATPAPAAPAPAAPVPNVPTPDAAPKVPTLAGDLLASVDALAGRFGCLADGAASGAWRVRFAGYGCAAVGATGDTTVLALRPAVAAYAAATHAGLVLGPVASSLGAAIDVRARMLTTHQLRTGSAPNPWEVGWLVWHYTDDEHFYYFIAKPNGWELGKRDPAYPGGQRFLATGGAPRFPVGDWHDVAVTQRGATITVTANGRELVTFVDREAAYTRGNVGVYSEDAAVVARVTPASAEVTLAAAR